MEEERQLAMQHQMALQAQVNEGHAHVKVCISLFYVSVTAVKVLVHPKITFSAEKKCIVACSRVAD